MLNMEIKTQLRLRILLHNLFYKKTVVVELETYELIYELLTVDKKYTTLNPALFVSDFFQCNQQHNEQSMMDYLALFCKVSSPNFNDSFKLVLDDLILERMRDSLLKARVDNMPSIVTSTGKEYIIDREKAVNHLLEDGVIYSKMFYPMRHI